MLIQNEALTKRGSPVAKTDLYEVISTELHSFLNSSDHPNKRLNLISKKTGIHVKTLKRILNKENRPTAQTIFKIYQYITQAEELEDVIKNCCSTVGNYLKKNISQNLKPLLHFTDPGQIKFKENPVFTEIYVLCSLTKLTASDLMTRFGRYGIEIAESMVKDGILEKTRNHSYIIGKKQISLNPEDLLYIGTRISKSFANPELGFETNKNHLSFVAERLSDEGLKKWIQADEDAYQKKLAIAKDHNNHGLNKVFTFSIVDTILIKKVLYEN